MKTTTKKSIGRRSIIILSLSLIPVAAWSATGKVTKVQGNRAIVQFDQTVKAGDVVTTGNASAGGELAELDEGGGTAAGGGASKAATRKYAFEYSFAIGSTSVNGASATAIVLGPVSWWFNFKQFELAGVIGYSSSQATISNVQVTNSIITLGGIGQYDFVKNVPGVKLVPGAYGRVEFQPVSSSPGSSSTNTILGIGISVDWFPFGEHLALNGSLEYDTQSNSANSATQSQFSVISGFKGYF